MSDRELRDELEKLSAKVLTARREAEAYSHELAVTEAVRAAEAATPELEARLERAKAAFMEASRTERLLRESVKELQNSLEHSRSEIAKRENPGDPLEGSGFDRRGWRGD